MRQGDSAMGSLLRKHGFPLFFHSIRATDSPPPLFSAFQIMKKNSKQTSLSHRSSEWFKWRGQMNINFKGGNSTGKKETSTMEQKGKSQYPLPFNSSFENRCLLFCGGTCQKSGGSRPCSEEICRKPKVQPHSRRKADSLASTSCEVPGRHSGFPWSLYIKWPHRERKEALFTPCLQ